MFTVIIPLYNKAAYVGKALQSVFHQTYPEFELIVVNDGSTDDSFAQLSVISYQLSVEDPVSYKKLKIVEQKNQGVSAARNNGVKIAKYDYIAFLDADDWWEPDYLQEMKNLIESFPEAGIYGSGYYIVKNGRKRIAPVGIEPDFEKGLINYCRVYANTLCMPLWTGATIIKKNIFESEQGFKLTLKLGEDFDLWVRVATKYPVVLLNKQLANYNQDVVLEHRAIGDKLYKPDEHMLFADYTTFHNNTDFRYLFERLALYGLLPYYLKNKNRKEVEVIISQINWYQHEFKYRLYYKIMPRIFLKIGFYFLKTGSKFKKRTTSIYV